MTVTHQTSREWFEDAERSYIEQHQGCPWCCGSHRVHRLNHGQKCSYMCQNCDFQVTFDYRTGKFHHIIGEDVSRPSAETMHEE